MLAWVLTFLIIFFPLATAQVEAAANQGVVMVFTLDSNVYTANGESIVMDVSPTIIENRTMLPIRYAATPLGADVGWDAATQNVERHFHSGTNDKFKFP